MGKIKAFFKKKDVVLSGKRYGIDALGAMAQGLFCSLLVGTILKTLGQQIKLDFLVQVGDFASAMSGAAMAVAIGLALKAPALVLFSLATVGYAANAIGGAGGPLAVLVIAIVAAEGGKIVSKETKIDILVTPIVTILIGVGLAVLIAGPIGKAAMAVGDAVTAKIINTEKGKISLSIKALLVPEEVVVVEKEPVFNYKEEGKASTNLGDLLKGLKF